MCQSSVMLIPPISLSHDGSPTFPWTEELHETLRCSHSPGSIGNKGGRVGFNLIPKQVPLTSELRCSPMQGADPSFWLLCSSWSRAHLRAFPGRGFAEPRCCFHCPRRWWQAMPLCRETSSHPSRCDPRGWREPTRSPCI